MLAILTDNLKKDYNLTLKTDEVKVSFFSNWPQVSVDLKNIYLSNDLFKDKNAPLLKAGSLSLSFNLKKLIKKQFIVKSIVLRDAEINLLREADGSRNFEIHSSKIKESASSNVSFEVSKIEVKKTSFKFTNLERGQKIDIQFMDNSIKLKHYLDAVSLDLSGRTLVNQLLFNARKGAFLNRAKVNLSLIVDYFKDTKSICVRPSSFVEIEKQHYQIASLIYLKNEQKFALYISGEKIWCEKVSRLLTPKLQKTLSNFDIRTPISANFLLVSRFGRQEDPVIIANVDSKNTDLTIGSSKIPYSALQFKGKIVSLDSTRQHGDEEHAQIIFSPVSGNLYDFPFSALVRVTNFTNPKINIQAKLSIDAQKIQSKQELILKGFCLANLQYSGPCSKLNKNDFLSDSMRLNADLNFKELSYQLINTPFVFVVNGNANVNNTDLKFDNLLLSTNGGNAKLKGRAYNFVNYALGFTKGFKADLSAYTENYDLNPYLMEPEKESKGNRKNKQDNMIMSRGKFEFNISLFAKKLSVRKVQAQNADIKFLYKPDFINLKSVNVNACDGKISGKGTLEKFNKLNADVWIQNVNVIKLFEQFENFGQKSVTSQNLKGNISVDAKLKASLDKKMEIIGESMEGEVKLKLKEGHLMNYEPLQNISRFVFKNRNFEDVTFSELNENFKVRGFKMEIDELEIASNVLNLYVVGGIYDFKGNSNLNLLIPWNNLKHRDKDYIPKSSGQSAENARGIKLNVSGPSSKMKISFGHKSYVPL